MTPVTAPVNTHVSRCTAFLKGEPKALGIVQIIIGIMMFLFGIILTTLVLTPVTISGITLWGGLIIISSGSLSVAAANHYSSCVVNASLGMNVISAVVAGINLILFPVDMIIGSSIRCRYQSYNRYNSYDSCDHFSVHMWNGIYGVLFVFSLAEFIISICTSAFACRATCGDQTTPMYSQPMYSQLMNPAPINPPTMNPATMNPATMNPAPENLPMMNPSPMNPPPMYQSPMYNPAFSDPQEPQKSSAYNPV